MLGKLEERGFLFQIEDQTHIAILWTIFMFFEEFFQIINRVWKFAHIIQWYLLASSNWMLNTEYDDDDADEIEHTQTHIKYLKIYFKLVGTKQIRDFKIEILYRRLECFLFLFLLVATAYLLCICKSVNFLTAIGHLQ